MYLNSYLSGLNREYEYIIYSLKTIKEAAISSLELDLKKLLKSLNSESDWLGLRCYKETSYSSQVRNQNPFNNSVNQSHGIMVEVLLHGQLAYSATSDLSLEGVQSALNKANELAKIAKALNLFTFDESIRPKNQGIYQTKSKVSLKELNFKDINERLIQASQNMKKSDLVTETNAGATFCDVEMNYVTSNGSEIQQFFEYSSIDLGLNVKNNYDVQKRSFGVVAQAGLELLDKSTLHSEADRLYKEALELLEAENCPEEKMDLILMPDQLYLQIHESIGHPLELDRILGDERNYAGWSFVSPEDFGYLKYGSNLLNVTFDPSLGSEFAAYNFDDNGAPAQKEYLIKEGLLKRAIGGIESQMRSGIKGVSCARAQSWNRAPIDRMANINIESGESSWNDIISSTKKGIIMETNRSWSIDDYRNKFQFGCERARLVENGKITKTIKNPNYRGATTSFWNQLSHVGNKDTFEICGSSYCGKGEPNQVIRVGHATPVCKFEDIEVFGGA